MNTYAVPDAARGVLLVTRASSWFFARAWLAILLGRDPQGMEGVAPIDLAPGILPAWARAPSALYVPPVGASELAWLQRYDASGALVSVASVEATLEALAGYPAHEEAVARLRGLLEPATPDAPKKRPQRRKENPR